MCVCVCAFVCVFLCVCVRGTGQRGMIYLIPNPNSREGDLYMQVGGKAVAVYNYRLSMRRVSANQHAGGVGARAGDPRALAVDEDAEEDDAGGDQD